MSFKATKNPPGGGGDLYFRVLARVIEVVSGQPFTERLDIRNAGGAAITAGSRAELTQILVAGARIKSIRNAPGWSCSGTTSLACTVAFGADLATAATLEGPTVVITAGAATAKRCCPQMGRHGRALRLG